MDKFPYFYQWNVPSYRRGIYRNPFYTDEADYNTNAKSYYDYLARFNGFLHHLVDFINDLADRISDLENKLKNLADGLQKIINNLYESGAIDSKDPKDFKFNKGRNIATGNINLFSDKTDGSTFIRTAKGKKDKDVTIGYTKK